MRVDTTDTICAISTAHGVGGIAVVRVSGPQAIEVTDKIYKNIKGVSVAQQPTHTAKYGTIYTAQGEILDDVVVTLFKAPHSFTGPTPQFKSINSSALTFLHSPILTSIHDHWKNHSLD